MFVLPTLARRNLLMKHLMYIHLLVLQNISPVHLQEVVVYIDAITIVYEEASTGGPPLCFPIACIEAGNEHSLPNLELRLLFTYGSVLGLETIFYAWKTKRFLNFSLMSINCLCFHIHLLVFIDLNASPRSCI